MSDTGLFAAETTILGVGNVILRDEGFGVRVAEYLAAHYDFPEDVQVVDGGTLGIELTQFVTGTRRLLVIDSINGHAAPGTVFRFEDDAVMEHFQDKISAHEVGIQDVLALLAVTGKKIPEVVVIGAQPYDVEAGVELSEKMRALVPEMARRALVELAAWGIAPAEKRGGSVDYTAVAEAAARERAFPGRLTIHQEESDMCLAVPAKIIAIKDALAKVELGGVTKDISLMLLPEAKCGDYVLVHAGFAMQIVDEREAEETNALLAEMHGAPRTVEALS